MSDFLPPSLFLFPSGMTLETKVAKSESDPGGEREHPNFQEGRLLGVVVGFDVYEAISKQRFGKDAPDGFNSQVSEAAQR